MNRFYEFLCVNRFYEFLCVWTDSVSCLCVDRLCEVFVCGQIL